MSVPTPSVPFPEVPVAEWSAIETRTATGLFAYRQIQARDLLRLPDFGGGDLDAEQREEALRRAVSFRKPLSALALFLGVVALEDFVRDLAARLADTPSCLVHFPSLANLRAKPKNRPPGNFFKRLDTDPAGVVDPEEINKLFGESIGVEPVPSTEFWHLRDLILLRHTVAHHAAVIRQADVPRFGHFLVAPGRIINPPPKFVEDELLYLYRLGREIEGKVRTAIFGAMIAKHGTGWSDIPPKDIVEMIDFFSYFGYIESTAVPVGYSEQGSELRKQQETEAARIRAVLLQKCISDLTSEFGT